MTKAELKNNLHTALTVATSGGIFLSSDIAALIPEGMAAGAHQPPPGLERILTKRQGEILKLVSEGLCDKEIAAKLGMAVPTLHTHLDRIYKMLQAPNCAAAVVRFIQFGG